MFHRAKSPDQIFVHLVDTYLDRVYRYLCNLTRDDDAARDLSHETFQVGATTNVKQPSAMPSSWNMFRNPPLHHPQ